jgi:hypothetical protein
MTAALAPLTELPPLRHSGTPVTRSPVQGRRRRRRRRRRRGFP